MLKATGTWIAFALTMGGALHLAHAQNNSDADKPTKKGISETELEAARKRILGGNKEPDTKTKTVQATQPDVASLGLFAESFRGSVVAGDAPKNVGMRVRHVAKDGPAARSGIKTGDVLHKFNDQLLITTRQLSVLVSTKKPGDTVKLTVIRDAKPRAFDVKLGKRPARHQAIPGIRPNPAGDNARRLGDDGDIRQLIEERLGDVLQGLPNGDGDFPEAIRDALQDAEKNANNGEGRSVILDRDGNPIGEVQIIRQPGRSKTTIRSGQVERSDNNQ